MEPTATTVRPISLVLLDDHDTARSALVQRLRRHALLEVVGDTPDPGEAEDLVLRLRPDAVLVDTMREDRHGIQAVARLATLGAAVRPAIVVHVSYRQDGDWAAARAAGADAILLKEIAADHLAAQLAPVLRRVLGPERCAGLRAS
jgi:DNA-binding NarL/FixJ family response regulator